MITTNITARGRHEQREWREWLSRETRHSEIPRVSKTGPLQYSGTTVPKQTSYQWLGRHFAMHHLISGINFLSRSVSLAQITLLMMSHSLIHIPSVHHSHPPSHTHYFISGSKLAISTNLFQHSLIAPTWTAFLDYKKVAFLSSFFDAVELEYRYVLVSS